MDTETGAMTAMGRPRGRPRGRRSERNDIAVKIDRAVATQGRAIADHRGITLAELLSDMLRPHVAKAYRQMLAKLDEQIAEDEGER